MKIDFLTGSIHRPLPDSAVERIQRWEIVPMFFASLVLTAIAFYLFPLSAKNPVDLYATIAKDPYRFRELPYGARLLTPFIVHYLPVGINEGFRIVAFVSFLFSGGLLYAMLRLAGTPPLLSLLLLPGFYFAPTPRYIIANSWYIDPMSYWLSLAVFCGLLTGNLGVTLAGTTLGALNRPESLILFPVVAIAWWNKEYPIRSLFPSLLSALPGSLIYLGILYIWPAVSDLQVMRNIHGSSIGTLPQNYSAIFKEHGFAILISGQIYSEMMPYLWGPAFLGLFRVPRRIALLAVSHIFLSALPLLMANDFFRLPFFAFPAILLLAGVGLAYAAQVHPAFAAVVVVISGIHAVINPRLIWPGPAVGILLLMVYVVFRTSGTGPAGSTESQQSPP